MNKLLTLCLCLFSSLLLAQISSTPPSLTERSAPDHGLSKEIEALTQQMANDPGYLETELWMQQYLELAHKKQIESGNTLPDTSCILTIPVVFHVFHPAGGAGVPFSQINYAMQDLNRTFAGADADYLSVNAAFANVKSYTKIRFALASIDPKGNPTTGIEYYRDKQSGFGNSWEYGPQIASFAWDNYKYFNVYVMFDLYANNVTNNSGIAWYPSSFMSDNNLARVVYNYVYLGLGGSSYNNLEFNQTFTHECGHYLNLIHTFEGGNCANASDQCADTPPTDVAGAGCNAVKCSGLINGENYMDYNTSCYKNFTMDQNTRMEAAMNTPSRQSLWQYENLVATGLLDPKSENSCVMSNEFFAYSKTKLLEGIANDGSIEMPPVVIYACGGAAFALAGSSLQEGAHYSLSNVPAGLSVSILSAADGKSATMHFNGKALQHDDVNSLNNILLTFKNPAVVGANAGSILHFSQTFSIRFRLAWRTICSNEAITTNENVTWNRFETTGPVPRYYGLWFNAGIYYLENYGRGIITTGVNSDNIQFLPSGTSIGASSPWRAGGSQGVLYSSAYPDLNDKIGYVGFRMQAGKDFFYGWMHLSVSSTQGITLLEYQYNEKPNEPILAGIGPVLTLNSASICAGEPVSLMVEGAANYIWSTGATSNTITVSPSSSATYTVTGSSPGCPTVTATTQVTVTPLPIVQVNEPTICQGETATLLASNAESYLWSSGETGESIHVTPDTTTIYAVNGVIQGCTGTTIYTSVVVNPLPSDSVFISGTTLSAFESNAVYQWIDCSSDTWIPNETQQNFTPPQSGTYAVMVTTGACVDTSVCIAVIITSIHDLETGLEVWISPNPTTGLTRIELNHLVDDLNLRVYNAAGQLIQATDFNNTRMAALDLSAFPTGWYLIQINAAGKQYSGRMLKQ